MLIFISYRRDTTTSHAGRLYDHLSAQFGRKEVFLDSQSVPVGADYRRALDAALGRCSVFLLVIGPNWVERLKQARNADDLVFHEVQYALAQQIPIIPVLVGGASMPSFVDLPLELAQVSFRQGFALTDLRSQRDMEELSGLVNNTLPLLPRLVRVASRRSKGIGAALIVIAFAAFNLATLRNPVEFKSPPAQTPPELAVQARVEDNDTVHITWDRSRPEYRLAVKGELEIERSGGLRQTVELRQQDLTGGSVLIKERKYLTSAHLTIVFANGLKLTETVRLP